MVYRNWAFGSKQFNMFDPGHGFKKVGIFYRDCQPEVNQAMLSDLQAIGVPSGAIDRADLGCPNAFASRSAIEQAVVKFKGDGVTTATIDNDATDTQNITRTSQNHGFRPQWTVPDSGIVATTGNASFAPDPNNFNDALAITPNQYGADDTPGFKESPTDVRCDRIMTSRGEPGAWQSSDQFSGAVCDLTWTVVAAIDQAPDVAPDQLAAGLQRAGSVPFATPLGPDNFSAPGTTWEASSGDQPPTTPHADAGSSTTRTSSLPSDVKELTVSLYYDPYDLEIAGDPYPVFKRLRDEAPLYYNEPYDFYAVSRFADVERGFADAKSFISGRGGILELIKANVDMPPGTLIFEDPPRHTIHRSLLSRVFTPRRVAALEPKIRELCARSLDPLVDSGEFDFIADLGAQMPMQVIGMLFGIPEADQVGIREGADANLRTEGGRPMKVSENPSFGSEMFAEYIDWRIEHPSDDLMSDLLQAEFEDETGTTRRLTRDEALLYTTVVAGAGNETTTRLIGWAGKVLGDHPDQLQEIVADRSLIPNTIEELLRYEPPPPHVGRYLPHDVELYGQTVPAGSAILFLVGAANRDERRFDDPETFDIHRAVRQHLTFGYGVHYCLGAALARLEGRLALDEVLNRFPRWEVDPDRAKLAPTSTVRGWETLPVIVP